MSGCGTLSSAARVDVTSPIAVTAVPTAESLVPDATVATPDPSAPSLAVTGAASVPVALDTTPAATPAETDVAPQTEAVAQTDGARDAGVAYLGDDRFDDMVSLLMQGAPKISDDDAIPDEYDPWEKFNERMFEVNRRLDRYVLKPVATVYDKVMPDRLQSMISNGFDNIRWVPRFVNSALQLKWNGAGREVGRFVINSTLGIAGLFDIAKQEFGIEKSREDFGQTLGVWGAGPGPFLILPLLPPLTVRDAVGFVVDGAMNPLSYVLPFFWDRLGMAVGDAINERSLNLELYQGFEETVIDMYSAVRHGYLQRREQMIKE
jgi:phospholipid-binding lipoprotein MlaA